MSIPELNNQVPQRSNAFSRAFGRLLLRILNWQIEGDVCKSPKFLLVVGPHTSWWDFTNNLGVMFAIDLDVSWFIADKYTRGPVGKLLGLFGAVPVDRSQPGDLVAQMAYQFISREKFVLSILPEGTRKPVAKWKTGFWHIAKQANVPVQLVGIDFKKRATVFGPILELTNDIDQDIKNMRAFFKTVHAKRPENALYND